MVFRNIIMLNIHKPSQFGTIPTYISKPRILQLNCLFNNYNVVIPRSISFPSISMLKTNILVQFERIPTLRLEAM